MLQQVLTSGFTNLEVFLKTEYDSKGIAPSFESHFKEPKRNFKITSSLEMLQQVLTSGFTNLEVFLKENQIENSKLHHHLL